MTSSQTTVYSDIKNTIQSLKTITISNERKEILQPLIDYIQSKINNNQEVRINFICTHNSRRSHMAQVWAQTMAHYFNVKNVACYSGGTEETALFPKVVESLEKNGFTIQKLSNQENPIYSIKYTENEPAIIGFSKTFDNAFNPKTDFAAVLTCSQADEGCPFIAGAEKRIPITFKDPKVFDNTPQQSEKYNERSLQIAAEMFYVFSHINS